MHVPYKGAGPGMTALLANEVDMMFNGIAPAMPHVKSGKLKGLAVGGAKRSPLLPDVPTVAEASGLEFDTIGLVRHPRAAEDAARRSSTGCTPRP